MAGPKELGGVERLTEQSHTAPIRRRWSELMRYMVLLSVLGKHWEAMMRVEGVSETTIESWATYYGQLCREAGYCKPTELYAVTARIAGCFKTGLWYIKKVGE